MSPEHDKIKAWDPGHFSLPRDFTQGEAPKLPEEPLQSRIDRGVSYANKISPDDTDFADAVRNRIESDFNRSKAIQRDFDFTNRNIVDSALVGGPNGNGKIPTTVEELRADPQVSAAYDALPPARQRTYLRELAQNAKGDMAWNADSLRRYQELKGIA